MENRNKEYKEMLLLKGLEQVTEVELQRFKFFVTDEFKIAKNKLDTANRTELADQLIQSAGPVCAVMKTIRLFRKLNYIHVVNSLEEEKKKVDSKYKTNTKKKGAQQGGKKSQAKKRPVASASSQAKVVKKSSITKNKLPQAKPPKKKKRVAE